MLICYNFFYMTSPAVCKISNCGVLAIGRCDSCNRAFCESHQGYQALLSPYMSHIGQRYINECKECTLQRKKDMDTKAQVDAKHAPALQERVMYIAKKLAEKKVPLAERSKTELKEKQVGILFKKWVREEIVTELEPAWPVGNYKFGTGLLYSWSTEPDATRQYRDCDLGVTVKGDIVPMDNNPYGARLVGGGFWPEDKMKYPTELEKAYDEIRMTLENLAQKNGIKLTKWVWPPGDAR